MIPIVVQLFSTVERCVTFVVSWSSEREDDDGCVGVGSADGCSFFQIIINTTSI